MKTHRSLLLLLLVTFCLLTGGEAVRASLCEDIFQIRRTPLTERQIDKILAYRPRNLHRHPLTVGVEVEGVIPSSTSYDQLAQMIIAHVRSRFPEQRVRMDDEANEFSQFGNVYLEWGPRGQGQQLAIKMDGSLPGDGVINGVEITSPILRTPRDFQIFSSIMEHLIESGIYKAHPKAGVHVHIGMPGAQAREVALLVRAFTAVQDPAYEHFQVLRSRERFAERLSPRYLRLLTRVSQVTRKMNELYSRFHHKFTGLNLIHLGNDRMRTVEFRLFNSTEDIGEMQRAIAFSASLVEQVRTRGPFIQSLLRETPSDSEAFEELLHWSEDFYQRHFEGTNP